MSDLPLPSEHESNDRAVVKERLKDPKFLPSYAEVLKVFPIKAEVSSLTEETMDAEQEWREYCRANNIYECFTKEYIAGLSSYLVDHFEDYGVTAQNPLTILEVGAGSGKLSHFLNRDLTQRAPGLVNVFAVDDSSWEEKGWHTKPVFPIEKLDYREALAKYNPGIVLSSWMPPGEDWTAEFRQNPNVMEYILIGDADENVCGTYETWGEDDDGVKVQIPRYKKEGFEKSSVDQVKPYQIGKTGFMYNFPKSSTVSFRRQTEKSHE